MSSKHHHLIEAYGDLVFDLLESSLGNTQNAQIALTRVLQDLGAELTSDSKAPPFEVHERAWVLRHACNHVFALESKIGQARPSAQDRVILDGADSPTVRLKAFDHYFRGLPLLDRLVLLLREKHQIPFGEIASALGLP